MTTAPSCPYCSSAAVFHPRSDSFYNGHDYGPVWACVPCEAWVGCHPDSNRPLGIPTRSRTRKLKVKAHAVFDHSKTLSRGWERMW